MRWLHDVFGNSIAVATFADMASELRFESEILLEHYGQRETDFALDEVGGDLSLSVRVRTNCPT